MNKGFLIGSLIFFMITSLLSSYNLLFIDFFFLAIFLDFLIVNNYLKFLNKNLFIKFRNMFYPKIKIILFPIFFFIFYFLFNIELDFNKINDFILSLANVDKDINIGSNATVNINNPNLGFNIKSINALAAAISATGGATIGFKVAQYVGGPPVVKIMAGLGTMAVVQGTTTIMSRVLNNNSSNNKFISNKFICFVSSDNGSFNNLNDYPLNLLFDINIVLYGALIFLYIILNIYISRYILNLDYNKILPKNNFGKILSFLLSRYLKIWNKVGNFLLIFSYIMLFIAVFVSKIAIFIILNHFE